jgi:hypothetical protein
VVALVLITAVPVAYAAFTASTPTGSTLFQAAASFPTYPQSVNSSAPRFYHRMDDTSATTAADASSFNDPGVYSPGYTRTTGATADGNAAMTFVGGFEAPNTQVTHNARVNASTVYTMETWIRTTSTLGGMVMAFSLRGFGISGGVTDRQLFMADAGTIHFVVNSTYTLGTTASYNDGSWHHVVASVGANGAQLYVDKVLRASTTPAQVSSTPSRVGYWRLGGDAVSGSTATDDFLAATFDEAAVYTTQLSATRVAAHYDASALTGATAYTSAINADAPFFYWRLNETLPPVTAVDSSTAGTRPGQYWAGETYTSITGVVTSDSNNRGVRFGGPMQTLSTATSTAAPPTVYTLECYFRTDTTKGGVLISNGVLATVPSWNADRTLYMQDNGYLSFDANGVQATTTVAYNDNVWHHAVAVMNATTGMTLYVDNVVRATNANTVSSSNTNTYWRVGSDTLAYKSNTPTSEYFTGDIDEVAVYPTALTAARVNAHYTNRTAATYSTFVTADAPLLYWRLNETTPLNGAVDSSGNGRNGVHRIVTTPAAGAAGALVGVSSSSTATAYDGFNFGAHSTPLASSGPLTAELWFKVAPGTTGPLLTHAPGPTAWNTDVVLFVNSAGKLVGGMRDSGWGVRAVTSGATVTDGAWHHAAVTVGPTGGTRLYLDGEPTGTPITFGTAANGLVGQWRWGIGNLSGFSSSATSLVGSLDEVAVYPAELTPTQVARNYYANE